MKGKEQSVLWGGRFTGGLSDIMLEFGASIDVDIELLECDIRGSIAWAEALEKAGVLEHREVVSIIDGLQKVEEALKKERSKGTAGFDRKLEDVHMTVEAKLIEMIGDAGAKLHTGRSRNDQVATDERLYLLGAISEVIGMIASLQKVIVAQAERHVDPIVPSYTHLQQALPVRLGHYLMSWFWMLERDKGRFADAVKRVDALPLGSGAVAGSGFEIDRDFLAEKLGFSSVTENSIDAVSDRDYIVETIAAASLLMMHLSRIAEDCIIWSSAEFGFIELPEQFSTGSSMMPQKKNPDSLELVRGKTGRVYGNLVTVLTVLKGLPLSYSKDMQEDKEPLFDTLATIRGCLAITGGVVDGMVFNTDRMRAVFDETVFATDIADYLTGKGLPFRQAHEIAGKLVKWSIGHDVEMSKIPMEIFKEHSELFESDVVTLFDLAGSTEHRSLRGGTGKSALVKQIERAGELLSR